MPIPKVTSCAPLIANLFLYCNDWDFMSYLQKSNMSDLIDTFNETTRYLDHIFIIDNPATAEHIPDGYFLYAAQIPEAASFNI